MIPTLWHSGEKKQNYGDSEKIRSCQELEEGGMNRQSIKAFSGQRKHFGWYHNDGYTSLYIGPKKKKMGLLGSSADNESACNAGDPGLISGLGRSPGEGKGYPLQYSWASLVTQLVKNLAVMQETWVRSLGWEDPREKEKATHSSILAWRIPWTVEIVRGVAKSWTRLRDFHFPNKENVQHQDWAARM